MLECRSCALRCMRAIAGDAATARQPLQQRLLLTPHLEQRTTRRAASTVAAPAEQSRDAFDDAFEEVGLANMPGAADRAAATKTAPLPVPMKKDKVMIENKKALEMELRYLKDPLKLSEHVIYTLRCEKPEKALDLCRMASRSMSCIVSWNSVIDYLMKKKKVSEAIKVYNEMKKRAQFPDSYTYMMVLRGLSFRASEGQPVREENVSKAISIYTSMNASNSRVKPNIMHTNATINVCALALDMDALWSVAGQLPEKGPQAADRMTYTIILNALRHSVIGDNSADASLDQIAARRQKAVDEGRRIWVDIIRRWRAGEVKVDEDLVAAMGRLLLASKRLHDWDNVLDLVEQTMSIERLMPRVGSAERQTDHVPQYKAPVSAEGEEVEVDEDGFTQSPATKAFKVVKPIERDYKSGKAPKSLVLAEPGPLTMSLLVDACQQMRVPKVATAYWELLTSQHHDVVPDLENFDRQLRLYATNRASAKAAKLIREDLPAAGIKPKNSTFRFAMSACQRDMKNSNVLEHATTIIDVMEQTTPDPDPQTLIAYLSLALTTDDATKIVAVINRMDSIVHNLRSRMSYGSERKMHPQADVRELKHACAFLQSLVGTIDTLMHRELVPREDFKQWHARRADLTKFLGTATKRLEKRGRDMLPDPAGDRKLGKPLGFTMGKEAWALRKFRFNNPEAKERRKDKLVQERDAHFNPSRRNNGDGESRGFGMDR